jgi:hypothetical protein
LLIETHESAAHYDEFNFICFMTQSF